MEEMAGPIAVERTESTFALDHLAQGGHDRGGRFLFDELCIVDLAGRVIQNYQQIVATIILKPSVRTAIQVQQHPGQGSACPTTSMHSSFPTFVHQSGHLESALHPGVAQADVVLCSQLLVKMPHVEI